MKPKFHTQNPRVLAVPEFLAANCVWAATFEPRMSRAGDVLFYALVFCILCLTGKNGTTYIGCYDESTALETKSITATVT